MQLAELATYIASASRRSPDDVAEHFGASTRTIRTHVRRFNDAFADCAEIQSSRTRGYRLVVSDPDTYEAKLRRMETLVESSLPATPGQRTAYLVDDLLTRSDWVKIEDLAQALLVSRRTVSKDLERVKEHFTRYGLGLEEKPYHGVRVTGPEVARRSCWTAMAMGDFGPRGAALDDRLQALATSTKRIVDEVLSEFNCATGSVSRQNLIMHIAIAILRICSGEYAPMEVAGIRQMSGERAYAVAQEMARRIGVEHGVELPEEEVAYIAVHLSGSRLTSLVEHDSAAAPDGTVVSEDVWRVVTDMLETVNRVFGFDFRSDLELRMNLSRHVAPLAVRLSYRVNLTNPILADIKRCYPLAYAMAADSSAVLAHRYGSDPSDDEVGYIALSYALAMERRRGALVKKRVLLVCASGAGTSRLLAYRFKGEFGPLLESLETCDVGSVDRRDFSRIDYVFTTVPIRATLPVPVQEINSFLDEDDISDVHRALRSSAPSRTPLGFFAQKLFFTHLTCAGKEEVIDFLADRMIEYYGDIIEEDFTASVHERERAFSTAFGNLVAIPHPAEARAKFTAACMGLLDEPVVWDARGNEVRVVILMAFSREESEQLASLMGLLSNLLTDSALVSGLLADQSWDHFAQLLEAAPQRPEGGDTDGIE